MAKNLKGKRGDYSCPCGSVRRKSLKIIRDKTPLRASQARLDFGFRSTGKPKPPTIPWKVPKLLEWQSRKAIRSFISMCMIMWRERARSSKRRMPDRFAAAVRAHVTGSEPHEQTRNALCRKDQRTRGRNEPEKAPRHGQSIRPRAAQPEKRLRA